MIDNLEWAPGSIDGTVEAISPMGFDPFKVADRLRERDPDGSYAVDESQPGYDTIVCFPAPPVAPEPFLWGARLVMALKISPLSRESVSIIAPHGYIEIIERELRSVLAPEINVRISDINPVDFGPDEHLGGGPSVTFDTVGEIETEITVAVGMLARQLARVYPSRAYDPVKLAKDIHAAFDAASSKH